MFPGIPIAADGDKTPIFAAIHVAIVSWVNELRVSIKAAIDLFRSLSGEHGQLSGLGPNCAPIEYVCRAMWVTTSLMS
jgi:hypothetical protein